MFIYSPEAVYLMDKAAVENDHLPEIELMYRAGYRVWSEITQCWPEVACITVFAGSGNNGGDAFVVALLAQGQGVDVQLLYQGDLSHQSRTSAHFLDLFRKTGARVEPWQQQVISGDVIVDGLLGIGLSQTLDDQWQGLIDAINQNPGPVVSIDIPSGLDASTGTPRPRAIYANITVTFIAIKTGHFMAHGVDYCGRLVFDDLGISRRTQKSQAPALIVLDETNIELPEPRRKNSHKNEFGHILVVGGAQGMQGAALLAAGAALRMGAGMVSVLLQPGSIQLSDSTELMVSSWNELEQKLPGATVILVGPGLGESARARACLQSIAMANKPIVVDASALQIDFLDNTLAASKIITPHPGEAARLLCSDSATIQGNRIATTAQLCARFDAVTVLKGSGTIIQQRANTPAINVRGNAGMASAGMGDVLAGMIAGLLGQGLRGVDAANAAVLIHALCAESYARDFDQTGLIAGDIIERLPLVLHSLRDV